MGTSGSGKTSLLSLLAGLDLPTEGEIWINGSEITQLNEEQRANLRLNHVGFVFQGFQLLANLTALENVMLPSELRGDKDAEDRALKLLDRVELSNRVHHQPNQLSGGEQQMLAIGRALMTNPKLLILDEATEGLAPLIRDEIWRVLESLKEQGQSILLIDKNLEQLMRLVDQHFLMERGRIVWEGTSKELRQKPELIRRYLGI